ncbi:hypothetical protein ACFLTH_15180 [Bacteroidota bacterium]
MNYEWYSRVRDMARFSMREKSELLIASIIFGFILSFKMWGGESFNATIGLTNWLIITIFVIVLLVWDGFFQKVFSLWVGYKTHLNFWFPGILTGLFITFITLGTVPVIFPNMSYYDHNERLRLGHFRYGINTKDLVLPAVAGVSANLFMALFMSFFYVATQSNWFLIFIKVSFLYTFFSMLPIPKIAGTKLGDGATAGFYMFFYKRQLFVFMFVSMIIYAILIWFSATIAMSFWLLILSLIIGLIAMFIFLRVSEEVI